LAELCGIDVGGAGAVVAGVVVGVMPDDMKALAAMAKLQR